MHDPLNAIRRLYGEPGDATPAEELSPEGKAEFAAMADLKVALDRLPPRSPDPAAVAAVVAAAEEAARPAALAPVRAVYGEGEVASDAARAEVRALAGVKAGLDALPPQRPDASLVDAVVRAAGEAARTTALAPIRAVYGEDAAPLTTEAAEAETAALTSVKTALDRLPSRRPDPSVIDAVVAAAARPSARPATVASATGRAADRPARRVERRRRVAAVLGAVFAVVLVFGGGLWLNQETPDAREVAATDRVEAEEQVAAIPQAPAGQAAGQAESSEPAAPPAADLSAPLADEGLVAAASPRPAPPSPSKAADRRSAPSAAPGGQAAFESFGADAASAARANAADDVRLANAEALARDSDDELRLLYLRVHEMQEAQAGLGWDTPPVALGAEPISPAPPPETGWMQVRVQR